MAKDNKGIKVISGIPFNISAIKSYTISQFRSIHGKDLDQAYYEITGTKATKSSESAVNKSDKKKGGAK